MEIRLKQLIRSRLRCVRHSYLYPLGQMIPMTPEQRQVFRWEREIDERNRPLTDDELDAIMPKEGYKVVKCLTHPFYTDE